MDLQSLYDRAPHWIQGLGMQLYGLGVHRERYGHRFEAVLQEILRTERFSEAELQAYQEERLRDVVRVSCDLDGVIHQGASRGIEVCLPVVLLDLGAELIVLRDDTVPIFNKELNEAKDLRLNRNGLRS